MNISVDGGGLCLPPYHRYGNYTFSANLLHALSLYDQKNIYTLYSFCTRPRELQLSENMVYFKLLPKLYWMSLRLSWQELWAKKDIFLALNQAIPLYVSGRVFGFSHGLAFMYYPGWYKDSYRKMTNQAKQMVKRAEKIIVPSERVEEEFAKHWPHIQSKLVVLPYGVPADFVSFEYKTREPFFLFAGMNHPIKNIKLIVDTFQQFISDKRFSHYKLFLAGPGAYNTKHLKNVEVLPKIDRAELKLLMQKATAYLTASHYESFNLPVLEALSQNCQVVGLESAIIPEMQSYCMVARSPEEFLEHMKKSTTESSQQEQRERLLEQFSWHTYVDKLLAEYKV